MMTTTFSEEAKIIVEICVIVLSHMFNRGKIINVLRVPLRTMRNDGRIVSRMKYYYLLIHVDLY